MTGNAALSGAKHLYHILFDAHPIMTVGTKIIDIRADTALSDIVADIKKGLRPEDGGEKKLPTLLLYSEAGLKLFEKITYLEEVRHSTPNSSHLFLIAQSIT
jgi:uncharacterized SAM-dependent methyltransferase